MTRPCENGVQGGGRPSPGSGLEVEFEDGGWTASPGGKMSAQKRGEKGKRGPGPQDLVCVPLDSTPQEASRGLQERGWGRGRGKRGASRQTHGLMNWKSLIFNALICRAVMRWARRTGRRVTQMFPRVSRPLPARRPPRTRVSAGSKGPAFHLRTNTVRGFSPLEERSRR